MSLDNIIVWLKRATGIGYKRYKPLSETTVSIEKMPNIKEKADRLNRDFDRLERELRRIGIRIYPVGGFND